MSAHVLAKHENCRVEGNCPICDGGLAFCVVCKGFEASLPTECPGRPLDAAEEAEIMAGAINFRAGKWVQL